MQFKVNRIIFTALVILAVVGSVLPLQAQVPGQIPLNPKAIPQFVDPLPHFAGARINMKAGGTLNVEMRAITQQVLSTGTVLPVPNLTLQTRVWAYKVGDAPPLWPAYTIEAKRGVPLNVVYKNFLGGETYSSVGLTVDGSLHWALHPMALNDLTDPPTVVHLHGGEVPPWADGGPDAWFRPGLSEKGHAFMTNQYTYPNTQEAATLWFHDHALGITRLNVYAGLAGFYFLRGDDEEAAHLPGWSGDDLPGWSGDDLVQEVPPLGTIPRAPYKPEIEVVIQDRMFDTNGQLYFPSVGLGPEHPIWVPEFIGDVITVNGKTWPYLSVAPRKYRFRLLNGSNARFYELWLQDLVSGAMGPQIVQIGTDGGLLDAPVPIVGKLILAPGERADVVIDFSANPGAVWTMRNSARTPYPKGGTVTPSTVGRIMQFVVNGTMVEANGNGVAQDESLLPTALRATNLVPLTNNWTALPNPAVTVDKVRLLTLNEVMAPTGPFEALVNNTKWSGKSVAPEFAGGVRGDFKPVSNGVDGTVTYYSESPQEGKTEIWKIINMTADAHPIHLHLIQFQLLSRQRYNVNKYSKAYNALFPASAAIDLMTLAAYPGGVFIGGYGPPQPYDFYATAPNTPVSGPIYGGNPDITPYLQGAAMPANPNERGWKDTFIMYPGEVTTVIARWSPTYAPIAATPSAETPFPFNPNGGHGYVWHCHIIDHEDNEMMRPYDVAEMTGAARTVATLIPLPVDHSATVAAPLAAAQVNMELVQTEDFSALKRLPEKFELSQNYPNPFNPTTEIPFALPQDSYVQLKIYNSVGQEVATLIDGNAPAGYHTVKLDAGNLASGIYFYKISAGSFTKINKMLLVK